MTDQKIEPTVGAEPRPRIVVCGLIHESNSFADAPTPIDAFLRLDAASVHAIAPTSGTEVGGALVEAEALGAVALASTVAMALSSGPVDDATAETLIEELVAGVVAHRDEHPIDAVVACLHGAMCSVSNPDIEGEALGRLRAAVGPDVALVATLDWHAGISEQMVASADALIAYRTYPHVDQEQRGRDAARLAWQLAGHATPVVSAWVPVPMLVAGPATRDAHPAMRAVLDLASARAADDSRVLTWSVVPGFARSDSPHSGAHVYVAATDGSAASALARDVAAALWRARDAFAPTLMAVDDAIDHAVSIASTGVGPVVLSDQGDNPGAGAPGDSTVLFEALERRQVAGALVASLCAPEAVTACHDAGVGAGVSVRLGSSTVDVTVEAVTDGRYVINSPTHPNVPFNIGPAALVRSPGGVGIVLTSTPVQNEDLQLFDLFGLDITQPPIVAVKSNAHFRAAFEPIATAVIDVDTPGIATPHLARLPYRHVRRPIWPLDPNLEWQPA